MAKLAALWTPSEPVLRGRGGLFLNLSAAVTPEVAEEVTRAVSRFVQAGNLGGYRHRSAPTTSHLRLASGPDVSGSELRFVLATAGVDLRAFQYLRHMVSRVEQGESSIVRIEVRSDDALSPPRVELGVVDDDNEAEMYPEPAGAYGFTVDWVEDVQPSKSRRVLVEFPQVLRRRDFDRLAAPVGAWCDLLESGAFALPFALPDSVESVGGLTTLLDPYTAEIDVAVFKGSEVAFDCLLNLLDTFSQAELPIASVQVE